MLKPQVRNFLLLIFSAILFSCILVFSAAYYFGPNGAYRSQNILLQPELLKKLPFHNKSGDFNFDHIEYQYYKSPEWKTENLSLQAYQEFFNAISGDSSILNPPDHVLGLFMTSSPSRMIIKLKSTSGSRQEQTFQEIHFASEGDYYRVELHEDNPGIRWAYFKHPGILNFVTRLAIKKT